MYTGVEQLVEVRLDSVFVPGIDWILGTRAEDPVDSDIHLGSAVALLDSLVVGLPDSLVTDVLDSLVVGLPDSLVVGLPDSFADGPDTLQIEDGLGIGDCLDTLDLETQKGLVGSPQPVGELRVFHLTRSAAPHSDRHDGGDDDAT